MKKLFRLLGLIGSLSSIPPLTALAFLAPDRERLPDYDRRTEQAVSDDAVSSEQKAAAADLRALLPRARVDFDQLTGAPKIVSALDGMLSGSAGQGKALSAGAARAFAVGDPDQPTKAFLTEHRKLFGHGPEVLAAARVTRQFVTPHNALRTVVWQQQLDGIPVFESVLISHTTRNGELVNIAGGFIPNPDQVVERSLPNHTAILAAPPITAQTAVTAAARDVGETVTDDETTAIEPAATGPEQKQTYQSPQLSGEATAALLWLPINRDTLSLAWDVQLTSRSRSEMFRLLVDAQTGAVLLRRCLTEYISDASYRVFTSDSPSPFSPGHPTPQTGQPPLVARTLVTWPAENTNASPNGWIDDGINETRGNNVDAHLDRNNDNLPDTPRPQGSPFRVFDFPLNLSLAPLTYTNAAVVQLFYWNNWMHDKLYDLGFTEAAGNFQINNFGRGGFGNDAVQADAQDGGGFNNANMSTPSDGSPARMQMYLFNGPTPDRDGDFDTEIVLHEYTHGLSNRRVGGGTGLSASQSRGMGEGWSDWYGLALLSEPGDDLSANYAAGGYATYLLSGLTTNYYFGIRRYPYSTDMTRNPLTFKDIDGGQASPHQGIPRSPIIGNTADEVHNQGEVWCVTLWDARANLINKHGFATGNQLILQLVTDGMNLSPVNPNFLQARNAILHADLVNNGGANLGELWAAFAKRGMGNSATSPSSSTTFGVVEAYDVPDNLSVAPATGFTSSGPVAGPFTQTLRNFTLVNIGTDPLQWQATASSQQAIWLNLSQTTGTLAPGASNSVIASLDNSAYALAAGIYTNTLRFTNTTSGVTSTRPFTLRVGQPDFYTELFDAADNDLDNQTLTFTPDGSTNHYSACREPAFTFPTDPTAGANLALGSHTFMPLTLASNISIYGRTTNIIYLASEGHLTLLAGDSSGTLSLANHFSRPRVSASLAHIHPTENGGTVRWVQLSNRVAITFNKVIEYSTANTNSFQIELFYDGRIRLTHLALGTTTGLVGLSRGNGIPAAFLESDLSAYGSCAIPLALNVPVAATEGDGVLVGQGHVNILLPASSNLTVTLSSSDTSEATAPPTVTIPAGQTNATFDITIIDDPLLDGGQLATLSASTPGYALATDTLHVRDNETATLTLALPASVTEGDPPAQATLTASAIPDANITVNLTSSDPTEIHVPSSVVLPAGQASTLFNLTIINDTQIDGDQPVTVTAHVTNWTSGATGITVHDNEPTNLVVLLPASAREGNGVLVNAGTIRIAGTLPTNLVVSLLSSDTTELTLPATTTIPAGQTLGTFHLTIADDPDIDSSQTVTVTASADGFTTGITNMTVTDDESPPEPFDPSPAHLATDVIQTADLSWQSGATPGEVITNDVYFGTNPTPGPAEAGGTTTSPNWPLPLLAPQTTYYWQIIARKTGATPSPVWQFTTRGVDHFVWDPISSPQYVSQPFSATVTAKDAFSTTVSNFTATVNLSGSGSGGQTTNTILGNIVHTTSSSGNYTLANGITPSANLTVTHVRSYSGTKVSIWSDGGALLASQNVTGPAGTWTETPLASPLQLIAGTTYRVSFYTAGGTYYYRLDRPDTFPNGTLVDGYYYSNGDTFPSTFYNADEAFFFCDLRYVVGAPASVPITPTVSGTFINGKWTGNLSVLSPTTNLTLRADDNNGHIGLSTPFAVQLQNDIAVTLADSPDPVSLGGNVTYAITITNIGPNPATDVIVTNILPAGATLVSVVPSQGATVTNGNMVVCNLGALAADASATVSIVATATAIGVLTNRTTISRAEPDAYPANNAAIATTTVATPMISINDVSRFEGNSGTASALFTVAISPPPVLPVNVNFTTLSGTAVAPGDFISTNGTLSFAPGETNKGIVVAINGDALYELDETFSVSLSGATNASMADSQGVGTILNDDPLPTLSIGDVTLAEGNAGTTNALFAVSLSGASGLSVTVSYFTANGSAISGSDYVARSGSLTIPAGSTSSNIAVAVNSDLQIESDEVFYVDLSSAGNAILLKREGYGLVLNDDGLPGEIDHFTWSAIASPQYAGQPFGVTVNALDAFNNPAINFGGLAYLSALTGPGTTNFLGTNTTTTSFPLYPGYDDQRTQVIYPASELGGAGRITSLALDVAIVPGLSLTNWTIRVKHTPLTNYTSYTWESTGWTVVYQTNLYVTATGWVVFPLATPFDYNGSNSLMVDFSFNNSTYSSAGYCRSTLRSATRTIYYYTYSGFGDPLTWTGSSPSPFTSGYTPNLQLIRGGDAVSIQPGVTGSFTNGAWTGNVTALTPATNLVLRASDGAGHSGSSAPFAVLLRDDISISVTDFPDPVGVGANLTYMISVTNTGPAAASGVVVSNRLPPTVTLVSVNPSQGTATSFGQTVVCNLGAINGGSQATVAILVTPTATGAVTNVAAVSRAEVDNYVANNAATNITSVVVPLIAINDVSVVEGNGGITNVSFTVGLSTASAQTVAVNYATANGTAFAGSDYVATNGVLSFAPGQTNQAVMVQILGDTNSEPAESFVVNLSGAVNANVGDSQGLATILNDDVPPYVYLRSTVGPPWGSVANETAMHRAFGTNNWQDLRYETVNPALLFSPVSRFIFMEGSEYGALELQAFLTANMAALQNWVAAGGRLFLNAAPNEGSSMNFGFGVTLFYSDSTDTANAANAASPLFLGPFTPTGTSWSGGSFGHATVSGTNLTALVTNSFNGRMVLAERFFGNGLALFGGMTTDNFHSPQPQGANLRANILAYTATFTLCTNCPPTITAQPIDQSVMLGGTATFSVTASGTAPLGFQWRKDGINLSGGGRISGVASNRLTIVNLQTNDAGLYSVLVTNFYGSMASSNGTLTVEIPPPPAVPFGPVPTNFATGVSVHTLLSWNNSTNAASALAPVWLVVGTTRTIMAEAATAAGATVLNTVNFASASLSEVDLVIFTEGSAGLFVPDAATRTKVSDFVAAGGGLYVELGGAFSALDYGWVPTPGVVSTVGNNPSSDSIGIADPAHPIAAGLTDVSLDNWSNSSHGDFTADGGLQVVFVNDNTSRPVTLAGSFGLGRVVYNNLDASYGHGSASHAAELLVFANACAFASSGGAGVWFDVYLGTNAAALSRIATNLTQTTHDPGMLAFGTTYYWQIVSSNIVGSVTGAVWRFTTTLDEVHFALATSSVSEDGASATITVVRENPAGGILNVQFSTTNGTATAGADYTAVSGTLLFPAGVLSTNFQVPILDDGESEGNETVLLRLAIPQSGTNVLLATPANAVLAIFDNDGPPDFKITSLLTNNSRVVDHDFLTSDDRGGIAVSASHAFITGDSATARFNAADLTAGASLGRVADSLCTDLRSETVYSLGNGTIALTYAGGTVTTLIELAGNTGQPTGVVLPLSQSFIMPSGGNGIFSGYGRVVVHNGTRVYDIFVPSGVVTDRGAMAQPNWQSAESWSVWGVAEHFDGTLYVTYREANTQRIVRSRVPDGLVSVVGTFFNLSDMASFTVSPSRDRWYFHYEGSGQFGGSSETLGYADARFSFNSTNPPVIVSQPASQTVGVGGPVTFSVTASGGTPLSYFWRRNGNAIAGASGSSYTTNNMQLADSGDVFSCLVSNAYGSVLSSNATLTVATLRTFGYSGAGEIFIVPAGVTSILVECWGAQGSDGGTGTGGLGGYARANVAVTPGESVAVYAGQRGPFTDAGHGGYSGNAFNGGGRGWTWSSAFGYAGSGGGASDVRLGGVGLNNRVIVAGGGGGATGNSPCGGGAGGGLIAATVNCGYGNVMGGSQVAGGTGGQNGSLGQGGMALAPITDGWVGGGGGGYYGGGCGFSHGSGAGGSSYTGGYGPYVTSATANTAEVRSGNGQVIIAWQAVPPPALRFLAPQATSGNLRLQIATVDGSPITPARATNVWVYATTNLATPFDGWTPVNVGPVLTNGVLQLDGLSVTNATQLFFRAIEAP